MSLVDTTLSPKSGSGSRSKLFLCVKFLNEERKRKKGFYNYFSYVCEKLKALYFLVCFVGLCFEENIQPLYV